MLKAPPVGAFVSIGKGHQMSVTLKRMIGGLVGKGDGDLGPDFAAIKAHVIGRLTATSRIGQTAAATLLAEIKAIESKKKP